MKPLAPTHKELGKLLATEAVDTYIAENNSMDKRIHIPKSDVSLHQFVYIHENNGSPNHPSGVV